MESNENMPPHQRQLSSSQPNPSLDSISLSKQELLQIQKQRQAIEDREVKLKRREEALNNHDIELLKLKNQLHLERFKLWAKTLVSLAALITGFYLHVSDDNLGAFLIGSGLGGFGVTMATGTGFDNKE